MAAISKSARICETCGSPIDTTSSGDLGCVACLLDAGLDAEEEQSDPAFVSAPDQLGAYTIEHHVDGSAWELGHGAMGVTYRAIDKALDRPVALKIINTDAGSHSAEARERFMREARAAAALRHPNVATCTNSVFAKKPANSFMLWSWSRAKRSKNAFAVWDRSMFSQRSTSRCK